MNLAQYENQQDQEWDLSIAVERRAREILTSPIDLENAFGETVNERAWALIVSLCDIAKAGKDMDALAFVAHELSMEVDDIANAQAERELTQKERKQRSMFHRRQAE